MKLCYLRFLRILSAFAFELLVSCGGGNGAPGATSAREATLPPTTSPPAMTEQYRASLGASNEVPPSLSSAAGTGTVTVDITTRSMSATITTSGIVGVMAHIHEGPVGVNGPIIFSLTESFSGSGVWSTTGPLSEAQLATLRAGNYYFNVHSLAYPDGAIRGQILGSGSWDY